MANIPTLIKDINDFDLRRIDKTGGVTGSVRVKDKTGAYYQLKKSIKQAKLHRRVKTEDTDRENFCEVIAACAAAALLNNHQSTPEVCLVKNEKEKAVFIASKYVSGKSQTLDDYAKKQKGITEKDKIRFISFTSKPQNAEERGQYSLERDSHLKTELAKALAISAWVGDHDVNPANMLFVEEEGSTRIVRIDFGHAFQDLLNAPKAFGGRFDPSGNKIIDFLNRERVAGIKPGGSPSKLWRDYPGMTPSRELANAMQTISAKDLASVNAALDTLKTQFITLSTDPALNKKHILNSLLQVYYNITGKKPADNNSSIDAIFKEIKAFFASQNKQMAYAAKLMDLQVHIDEAIKKGEKVEDLKEKLLKLNTGEKIQWIRTSPHQPPFHGSFEAYVENRKTALHSQMPPLEALKTKITQGLERYLESRGGKNTLAHHTRSFGFFRNKSLTEQKIVLVRQLIKQIRESVDIKSIEQHLKQSKKYNGLLEKIYSHQKLSGQFFTKSTLNRILERSLKRAEMSTQKQEALKRLSNSSPPSHSNP